jgi:hypothetical protein
MTLLFFSFNTNYYICYNEKTFLSILDSFGFRKIKITILFFFRNLDNLLLFNFSLFSFPFQYLHNLKDTLSYLYNFFNLFKSLHRYKFELRGFAYKLKTHFNFFLFKLGYSHLVFYKLPLFFTLFPSFKKRKDNIYYTLRGYNYPLLGSTIYRISELRKLNIYSGYGLRTENQHIRLKRGKVSMF